MLMLKKRSTKYDHLVVNGLFYCPNFASDQRGGPDMRGRGMPPDIHDRGPGPNHREFHGPPDGPPGRGMPPNDMRGNIL